MKEEQVKKNASAEEKKLAFNEGAMDNNSKLADEQGLPVEDKDNSTGAGTGKQGNPSIDAIKSK